MILICAGFVDIIAAQPSSNRFEYPRNHLPWYTIESDHFRVHFQKGSSRSARIASRVAEEVYPEITRFYNKRPDTKTQIVLRDREDNSNGAAYFFDNRIEIWIPALNSPLRGNHDWMRNVITHEFTHIVQLQAAMKRTRRVPAVYFQWLSYEDVRRPDVLYGYPNGLISYPFSSISVPGWFAEGTAQFQRKGWSYDTWDSHRDMILRIALLNGSPLGFDEMSTFSSKTALEREMVYNHGFDFTIYLANRFGEPVLADITEQLGRSGIYRIDKAMEYATGISGESLYNDWVGERTAFYYQAVEKMQFSKPVVVEPDGYFNFYPTPSHDGKSLAYLSNKEKNGSGTSLYLLDEISGNTEITAVTPQLSAGPAEPLLSCGFNDKPLLDRVHTALSFSPGSERLVFAKRQLNRLGEQYNDLFIYDIKSGKESRLTNSKRITDPAWSPDGKTIAAVQLHQGSTDLVLFNLETGALKKLTDHRNGEQIYTPAWSPDGRYLYYSYFNRGSRSIRVYNLEADTSHSLLDRPYVNYRDPYIHSEHLYFSADPDGIYNIYRLPLDGEKMEQLTSLPGGAFMPAVKGQQIYFSEYREGGYKISAIALENGSTEFAPYRPVYDEHSHYGHFTAPDQHPNFNLQQDNKVNPFSTDQYSRADTSNVALSTLSEEPESQKTFYRYQDTFTKFSFTPVIRFDNYSKLNGSNSSLLKAGRIGQFGENLLRDMKTGVYFNSYEAIGRLSLFAGALFGFGSLPADGLNDFFQPARLTDLDRDLFLTAEYRGLPFIEKRWSPTISVELYNLRRNVRNGLEVEEFPCTACLPDTLSIDLAYNIWEANLFLRSKINEYSLLELGAGYSPYRVQIDGFFSRELQQMVPSTSSVYFKASTFSLAYYYENFVPYSHGDIAPLGLKGSLKYRYQPGKLLQDFEIEDGILSPVYETSYNHSVEVTSRYGFPVGRISTGQLYSRFFSYLNNPDDLFYLDYIGGFTGMRSYPFFALGGTTTALTQFSYITPLLTNINRQVGRHTLDKLFVRLYMEAGGIWGNTFETEPGLKTGAGAELRFAFNSYYLYPMKLFVGGSYGFDQFTVTLPGEFITETGSDQVTYGRELLFHFGLTFDFNLLNHE